MFRKILIANRGEIALRIIRTCKRLEVKTVAVYSNADLESKHVTSADEAYEIGGGTPSESYLNIPKIIKAAKKSRAEAIHPGYGFLAENPNLARACEENDVVFIGPSSRVLGQVGNKLESKKFAEKAGVPVVPGAAMEIQSLDRAESEARRIGFPVLVKAVYGGGGRGMRIVRSVKELQRAFDNARAEAAAGFGHSELYIEKYLKQPRHIEVQVLAGPRGKTIHLGERECSLQRRYQKILEETPSPAVSERLREEMTAAALKIATAAGYYNAGTVEFMLDSQGRFYFLEVNARLQVEHPITEWVTRLDLVREQIRIAAGERLGWSQDEVRGQGHACECRVYAEDPARGFFPSPGKVLAWKRPFRAWSAGRCWGRTV